jgi:hypothetical protein
MLSLSYGLAKGLSILLIVSKKPTLCFIYSLHCSFNLYCINIGPFLYYFFPSTNFGVLFVLVSLKAWWRSYLASCSTLPPQSFWFIAWYFLQLNNSIACMQLFILVEKELVYSKFWQVWLKGAVSISFCAHLFSFYLEFNFKCWG